MLRAGWEKTEGRLRAKKLQRVARQYRVRSICTWVSDTGNTIAPALYPNKLAYAFLLTSRRSP